MPRCIKCGSYTKYNNGLCSSCYYNKKSTSGKVYIGEVTFKSGKKTIYTGMTKRSVYERVGEHFDNQNIKNHKPYTGRGVSFRLIGSIFSSNARKAEKTIKNLPREEKIKIGRKGAINYKKRFWWF